MRIKELLAISMLTVSITAMAQTGKGGTWTLDDCLDYAIKSSDVSLAIAKAGKMPTIGINGSLGTSSSSMSDRAWGQQMKTNFDAGVGVSLSASLSAHMR